MAKHTLENGKLRIQVDEKGAELTALYDLESDTALLWDGNPDFWAKHSPVLFPIVGALRHNRYTHKGSSYFLSRHGFARDREFTLVDTDESSLLFRLEADEDTLRMYPFKFTLDIRYTITGKELTVSYEVWNNGKEAMYFSLGAHPAFRIPWFPGTEYNDYYLDFGSKITVERWPLSSDGLIREKSEPFIQNKSVLKLDKSLFSSDALVFKSFPGNKIAVRSEKVAVSFEVEWDKNFRYLGLWAAPGADFLCIEPWCGIADGINADGELKNKEGIIKLEKEQLFNAAWTVRVLTD